MAMLFNQYLYNLHIIHLFKMIWLCTPTTSNTLYDVVTFQSWTWPIEQISVFSCYILEFDQHNNGMGVSTMAANEFDSTNLENAYSQPRLPHLTEIEYAYNIVTRLVDFNLINLINLLVCLYLCKTIKGNINRSAALDTMDCLSSTYYAVDATCLVDNWFFPCRLQCCRFMSLPLPTALRNIKLTTCRQHIMQIDPTQILLPSLIQKSSLIA